MAKVYAGIGSRSTPETVLQKFISIASLLEIRGFHLRSGGALGADQAFEKGVAQPHMKEVLRPRDATEAAMEIAARIHPAWHMCDEPARRLHGRNVQIILGRDLQDPVMFVLAYTESPDRGGTRTGLVLAKDYSKPVFNFAVPGTEEAFMKYYTESL